MDIAAQRGASVEGAARILAPSARVISPREAPQSSALASKEPCAAVSKSCREQTELHRAEKDQRSWLRPHSRAKLCDGVSQVRVRMRRGGHKLYRAAVRAYYVAKV